MRAVAFLVLFATCVTAPALARGSSGPVRYSDGSYRYEFGGGIPTIRVGAGDSCDIELQAGETIRRAFLSDTVRWKLADGVSGANNVPHLVVKPTQAGIWTTLTVFTDRRSYHIRLTSSQNLEAEYVGFTYDADRAAAAKQANDQARAAAAAAAAIDATHTCKDLDSKYVASGANEFRNAQVCNDGKHTYINAPDWSGDCQCPIRWIMAPTRSQTTRSIRSIVSSSSTVCRRSSLSYAAPITANFARRSRGRRNERRLG